MKNILISGVFAVALLFSACGSDEGQFETVELGTEKDSFSYAIGILNGQNLKSEILTSLNASEMKQAIEDRQSNATLKYDENQQREIFQEFLSLRREEGASFSSEQVDKLSYAYGINLADNLEQMGTTDIDIDILIKAMNKFMSGQPQQMNFEEAQLYFNDQFAKVNQRIELENRQLGEAFLAENAARSGVVTTESGLQYEVLEEGNGPQPNETNTVQVHYHGTLVDGTVFDSSVERGEPIEFPVTGVIAGWTEALQLMPVGSKWMLYIPSDLAYGERGAGGMIGPGATLIFEVELLDIR